MRRFLVCFILTLLGQIANASDTTACLLPHKIGTKWGFVNKDAVIVIDHIFDSVGFFFDGLALAMSNDRWGFINETGNFLIEPKFIDAEPFSCGLARVVSRDEAYPVHFINKQGQVVFRSKVREVYSFHNDRALIRLRNGVGYLNKLGELVIKPSFPYGGGFSDGVAQVWSNKEAEFLDTSGRRIAYFFEIGHGNFSDGLAPVLANKKKFYLDGTGKRIEVRSRSFYMDKSGQPVITNTIDSLVYFPFVNGLAEVCTPGVGHKSGFIDKTGKLVIPLIYDDVRPFFSEYSVAFKDGEGFVIDMAGQVVAPLSDFKKYFNDGSCR